MRTQEVVMVVEKKVIEVMKPVESRESREIPRPL